MPLFRLLALPNEASCQVLCSMDIKLIEDEAGWSQLRASWQQLCDETQQSVFASPKWLDAWWRNFIVPLEASLYVVTGSIDGSLRFVAPMYRREVRLAGIKMCELRMMGDAGPRPSSISFTVSKELAARAGKALAKFLLHKADEWDVLALEPFEDPSVLRASLASMLSSKGCKVESLKAGGEHRRMSLTGEPSFKRKAKVLAENHYAVRAIQRLSKQEWAQLDETSPLAGGASFALLTEHLSQSTDGEKSEVVVITAGSRNVALALTVDDGPRSVVLAAAVDPEISDYDECGKDLLSNVAVRCMARGQKSLDVVMGASQYTLPELPQSKHRAVSLIAYGTSKTATVAKTYGSVAKRVSKAQKVPEAATARARAAWAKIAAKAEQVAGVTSFQLFRGELWTRGATLAEGARMLHLSQEKQEDWDQDARMKIVSDLKQDWATVEKRLAAGDDAVLAYWDDSPAGIVWASTTTLKEPRLGREIVIAPAQAYIYGVYVPAHARGHSLGSAMLEDMARVLRTKDVYQSWALVSANNVGGIRALQKAAYMPVADVTRTLVKPAVDRVTVRPPDPGARALLGL